MLFCLIKSYENTGGKIVPKKKHDIVIQRVGTRVVALGIVYILLTRVVKKYNIQKEMMGFMLIIALYAFVINR